MSDAAVANKDAAPAAPAGKSSKMKIGIILGVIVAVQCVLAFFLFAGGSGSAKAEGKGEKSAAHGDEHGSAHVQTGENREVDMGQFSVTMFNPNSNTTMLVDFRLYGTVDAGNEEHAPKADAGHGGHGDKKGAEVEDHSKFGKLFKKNKHRFRDQVIVVIRHAEMGDLADPGLALIKRQILAKTNSLLGEPLLKEVIFSDFAVVEQ